MRARGLLSCVLTAAGLAAAAPVAAQAVTIKEFDAPATATNLSSLDIGADHDLWFAAGNAVGQITTAGTYTLFADGLNPGASIFPDVVEGSDGDIWFDDEGTTHGIGKITTAGAVTMYDTNVTGSGWDPDANPADLVEAPDGNVWFLDVGNQELGMITPDGVVHEHGAGLNAGASLEALTVGPDNQIWFTDTGNTPGVGTVDTATGAISEYSGGLEASSRPTDLTTGGDGNIWFSDEGDSSIGRILVTGDPGAAPPTSKGDIAEFPLQDGAQPDTLTLGPDENVWVNDQLSSKREVDRVTPAGEVTELSHGLEGTGAQNDILTALDGNLWIEQFMPGGIARITPQGEVTEFTAGLNADAGADADALITGPDGNLWFVDNSSTQRAIGRVTLDLKPVADTGGASAVSDRGASLAASVTPLSTATTVSFAYGTTMALGSSLGAGTRGASDTPAGVSAALTGLPAGTTIYYRVVAANATGTTAGTIKSFRTTGSTATNTTSPMTSSSGTTTPAPSTAGATITPPASTATDTTPAPPAPPVTVTKSAALGRETVILTTPSPASCTASAAGLLVTLGAQAKAGGAKVHLAGVSLFLDGGIKATKRERRRRHGRLRTVTVTIHKPDATATSLPTSLTLPLAGVSAGTHALKVEITTTRTVKRHGRKRTKRSVTTLTASLSVC